MAINGPDSEDANRIKKIERLKQQAQKMSGGGMISGEAEDCPPGISEKFWEQVIAFEKAPSVTDFKKLEEAGVHLPAPDTLDDMELGLKLWEVVDTLATQRVFLDMTDHLSDRELYSLLWEDLLREERADVPLDQDSACHIDVMGSGSEQDSQLYLKYYADEAYREDWLKHFPEDAMPEHSDLPYDRDQYLPTPDYGPPGDLEFGDED